MEIKLIGALDYKKVRTALLEKVKEESDVEELLETLKQIEIMGRTEKVATAGRLSRFMGDIFEILGITEEKTLEQNTKFASMVTGMGHNSIADHDYCVFALKDVSILIEQTIIAERYSSFTVKSRREVDFSNVGFYTPDFHEISGNILKNNSQIKIEYQNYMRNLFNEYSFFLKKGLKKEDARYILPYSYNSNIIMGVNAHTLKDMIIKFTKTKYSKIHEISELGEEIYKIVKVNMPYLVEEIENKEYMEVDPVEEYLNEVTKKDYYKILPGTRLLDSTDNIDETIAITALMRRYQYDKEQARKVYNLAIEKDPEFTNKLIKKISFEGDGLELTQVNFKFQIPLSYAVLTHLTRHRAHDIIIPDFAPIPDLTQYKEVPSIKKTCQTEYDEIYAKNIEMVEKFKNEYGVREEDLVHFILSGNMVNCMTDINGKRLQHIIGLRGCTKTQWETREMALDMKELVGNIEGAENYASTLGPTCVTQGICNEGKECCGKVYTLKNCKMPQKI